MENQPLILVLYVDDLFLNGEEKLIIECKRDLTLEFEIKYLGLMHYFMGLDIWQRNDEIYISQGKYIVEMLCIFGMVDYKSINTPMDSNMRKLQ